MTISQSFIKFLEEKGFGTFGQNIYLYRVPNSLKTPVELFWAIPSGGSKVSTNETGEAIKMYSFTIYYRSNSAQRVDEVLSNMEELLNCVSCVNLEGYELVSIEANQFAADQDIDAENRMRGMITVQLEVYKGCYNN